jgi:hypothetical protein
MRCDCGFVLRSHDATLWEQMSYVEWICPNSPIGVFGFDASGTCDAAGRAAIPALCDPLLLMLKLMLTKDKP